MTSFGSCIGHSDVRDHSHARHGIDASESFFAGLAYAPASEVDEHVARLRSNLGSSAIDKCVLMQGEAVEGPVKTSRTLDAVHWPSAVTDIIGRYVVALERGTHNAAISSLVPKGNAGWTPCVSDVQGLPAFFGGLLKDLHMERLVGNHFLQPRVFLLPRFQLLGHLWRNATIDLPRAIIRQFPEQ